MEKHNYVYFNFKWSNKCVIGITKVKEKNGETEKNIFKNNDTKNVQVLL